MTTIYLINNSLTMNNINYPEKESLKIKREKRILSIEGEEESMRLAANSELAQVSSIYTSSYVMSIGTAKYLANALELDINVREELGERILGSLGDQSIRMLQEIQESDFDYRLSGGESLNDVKRRMISILNKILKLEEDKEVAIFTHNVAITCLLSNWCTKGFNLDNRLILNYGDEAIIDGAWNGISIFKLVFDKNKLVSISRKK